METTKVSNEAPPLVELRVWMARQGLRQTHIAKRIGVRDGDMSDYLKGRRDLRLDKVIDLSELTGIPPERLVTNEDVARNLKRLRTTPKFPKPGQRQKARHAEQ